VINMPDAVTAEGFAQLVSREHEHLELKSGAGRRPLQEAIVAFSNTGGGVILIGVRDDRR
jgi:predicted HTH transcriptional regulator